MGHASTLPHPRVFLHHMGLKKLEQREMWHVLTPGDPVGVQALRDANGEHYETLFTEWCGANSALAGFEVEGFGIVFIRDEGQEACIVSFSGCGLAKGVPVLKNALKQAGFSRFRLHTDDPRVLRLWRKAGIVPNEYVYNGIL